MTRGQASPDVCPYLTPRPQVQTFPTLPVNKPTYLFPVQAPRPQAQTCRYALTRSQERASPSLPVFSSPPRLGVKGVDFTRCFCVFLHFLSAAYNVYKKTPYPRLGVFCVFCVFLNVNFSKILEYYFSIFFSIPNSSFASAWHVSAIFFITADPGICSPRSYFPYMFAFVPSISAISCCVYPAFLLHFRKLFEIST